VTSDRETIRRLFTAPPLSLRHGNDPLRSSFGDGSMLLQEPPEHLARRKLELPPFHGERLRSQAELIRALFDQQIDRLHAGAEVELHPIARDVTLDVILRIVLGVRDAALRERLRALFESLVTPVSSLAIFLPETWQRGGPLAFLSSPYWERIGQLRELLAAHVVATRGDPALEERDDVLALLVQARGEDGSGLTDSELTDELVSLVAAGHETTATAIGWAADLLAHNPSAAEGLRAAAREGDGDYVAATVKEVLRARTVVPIAAARIPLEPFAVEGGVVGPDGLILVNAWDVHRDPAVHAQPEAFRPERFLAEPPDGYALIPFGGGAHRCLGASLAVMELEIALAAIGGRCVLEPCGRPARPVRRLITMAPDTRARVRIAAVEPARVAAAA
jgi:cytochrome P450